MMPVRTGKDKNGCFAQWGSSKRTKKFYYKKDSPISKGLAVAKAKRQGIAIKIRGG